MVDNNDCTRKRKADARTTTNLFLLSICTLYSYVYMQPGSPTDLCVSQPSFGVTERAAYLVDL